MFIREGTADGGPSSDTEVDGTNSRPTRKRARQEDGSDHDVPKQRRSDNDGVEGDTDGNSDSDNGSDGVHHGDDDGDGEDGDGDGDGDEDGDENEDNDSEAEEDPRRHFADITEATTEDDVRGLLLQLLRATLRHDDAAFPLDLESFQYNRAVDRIPSDVLSVAIADDDGRLSVTLVAVHRLGMRAFQVEVTKADVCGGDEGSTCRSVCASAVCIVCMSPCLRVWLSPMCLSQVCLSQLCLAAALSS
jgi:hypothetical protein